MPRCAGAADIFPRRRRGRCASGRLLLPPRRPVLAAPTFRVPARAWPGGKSLLCVAGRLAGGETGLCALCFSSHKSAYVCTVKYLVYPYNLLVGSLRCVLCVTPFGSGG